MCDSYEMFGVDPLCDYVELLAPVIRLYKMFGLCWIVSAGLSVCAIRQAVYTSALGTLSVLICILLKYKYKSKYKLKRVSVNTNTHQPSEVSTSCRLSSALSISYIPWTCYCYILAGRDSLFSLPCSLLPDCSSTTPPYVHFSYVSILLKGWNGTRSE